LIRNHILGTIPILRKLGKQKLFWRTNEQIRASSLRVIGEDGKLLGVMTTSEAIKSARDKDLTLVEIAPKALPPVAKIVDFGKFRYQEEKKLSKQAKKSKGGELKEVRFSPFIADNDFETRLGRVKEFLEEKNKVRIVVVFKGPQMRVKNTGYIVINKIKNSLGDTIITDMEPKFLGKHLVTVISPVNKVKGKGQDKIGTEAETKVKTK
jgi:translation initiation factor IF-3